MFFKESNRMKRVLMVLENEFPNDDRVEKEIESLQRIGYEVHVAVLTFINKPKFEVYKDYTIYRKPINQFFYKSSAVTLIVPFYFILWENFLKSILRNKKFDVIHIHDLPLSKVGYRLARKFKMKLVCDQHEYYSNWIVRTKHYNTAIGKIIQKLSNWPKYEREYLQKADLVITVEDSLKQIYIDKVQVSKGKIITLSNTPRSEIFQADNIDQALITQKEKKFVLFYAGGLDHLRGIDFIIETIASLKNDIKDIKFLVAGRENRAFSINELISKFQVENFVDFIGWVPIEKLPSYIALSDICVHVPKPDNLEVNNTIATKIYQYASMGKPVIVSEARMMKDFVEANRIGYSVKFGDTQGFCDIIKKLHDDPSIAAEIKTRAVDVSKQYTWENTSVEFTRFYEKFKS